MNLRSAIIRKTQHLLSITSFFFLTAVVLGLMYFASLKSAEYLYELGRSLHYYSIY